jgi:hypothetical protein
MKTKIRANAVSGCSFEEPLERLARDFLRFATAKLAADVAPPCAGVLIMSDDSSWEYLMHAVELDGLHDLRGTKAVAIYMPSTLEQRVRLATELQRIHAGEYDRFLDYQALICVRRPELDGNMLQVTVDLYYAIATSSIQLVILAKASVGGIGVVKGYEKPALAMMNDFFSSMTPDQFAARYGPEPS